MIIIQLTYKMPNMNTGLNQSLIRRPIRFSQILLEYNTNTINLLLIKVLFFE